MFLNLNLVDCMDTTYTYTFLSKFGATLLKVQDKF